jgi:cytochrome oxidase Cu insertion factor (SCO1/SenC/PrrC family)
MIRPGSVSPVRALLVPLLVGCGLLGACAGPAPSPVGVTPALQDQRAGSVTQRVIPDSVLSLPLRDQSGRAITLKSLRGKVVVLADFLTTCQEVCPLTSVNLRDVADAARRSGLGDLVEVVEVTVDPERDSPTRLRAYERLFGARPNWRFLTGRPADLATLWHFLGVAYSRTPQKAPHPKDWLTGAPLTYDVQHSDVVFVIDGGGRERWLVLGTAATRGESPPATLDGFLDDEGRANLRSPEPGSWTAADVEAALTMVTGRAVHP